MTKFNREDFLTVLPQLEKKLEDLIKQLKKKITTKKLVINAESKTHPSNVNIDITATVIDLSEPAPSATQYEGLVQINEKSGDRMAKVETWRDANDAIGVGLVATRYVNGSVVHNGIHARINADGTLGYSMTNPAAFRAAIMSPAMLKVTAFTSAKITQAANSGTANTQTITVPSGYEFVGIVGHTVAHNIASTVGTVRKYSATQAQVASTNRTSAQWTDQTHTVYALFVLDNLF